ncbi:MAG: AEC family transporter [Phycisphaeraceae bacterium]|nr:AEC family transporter [Phycisphaeraceae bacterium]
MEQWLVIAGIVAAVFSVMLIGALIRRANWLTAEADQALIHLVIRVLMPALILDVMVGNPRLQDAANVTLPPVVGFVAVCIGLGLSLLAARLLGPRLGMHDRRQQRTFAACVGVFNYGYLPLPLVERLFDHDRGTLGVLFVHNLGVEIAIWTIVLMTIQGGVRRDWYKQLLNAPLITILAALLINCLPVQREQIPGFLMQALHMLSVCAVPMALILVGATVADHLAEAKLHAGLKVIGGACLLRLGVIPVLFVLAAALLPASMELKRVMVVQAAMPTAVFPIVLAKHYGGDASTAVRVMLGTTLVSLLTMPLWLSGGLGWLNLY